MMEKTLKHSVSEFLYKNNFSRVDHNHFKNDKCEVYTDKLEVLRRGKSHIFTSTEKMKDYLLKLITLDQYDYEHE